jgi:GTP-binding protein
LSHSLRIEASFVTSAADAAGFPGDGLPEVALVGRSNVGKSSLINAVVRQRIARTSAAPGKTRLANIYRVVRGGGRPLYLVDLPGYGYARGGGDAARAFDELTRGFFGRQHPAGRDRRNDTAALSMPPADPAAPARISALLLVDSRHPGLESDRAAWMWLQDAVAHAAVVATKIDKLTRSERIRAMRQLESAFELSVLPVSAVTGEGLDELWILIDSLANRPSSNPPRKLRSNPPPRHRSSRSRATAARRPKK